MNFDGDVISETKNQHDNIWVSWDSNTGDLMLEMVMIITMSGLVIR